MIGLLFSFFAKKPDLAAATAHTFITVVPALLYAECSSLLNSHNPAGPRVPVALPIPPLLKACVASHSCNVWDTRQMRVRDRSIHPLEEKGGVDQNDQDQWWNLCL